MCVTAPSTDLSVPGWEAAVRDIAQNPGVVITLGAPDLGKSTWLDFAARHLANDGTLPLGIVDADIGQASVGPPATVSLSVLKHKLHDPASLHSLACDGLSFVGSVSPSGHLLQILVSTARLVVRGTGLGARTILVDTTGLITPGIGFQLKLRKIELLDPAHIVALQRDAELEALLAVIGGRARVRVHRLTPSALTRRRSATERSAYRARRFAAYFSGARTLELPASDVLVLRPPGTRSHFGHQESGDILLPETLRKREAFGLLLGLNTADDETLGLAALEGVSKDGLRIFVKTPLQDPSGIRIIQLGNVRLHDLKTIEPGDT